MHVSAQKVWQGGSVIANLGNFLCWRLQTQLLRFVSCCLPLSSFCPLEFLQTTTGTTRTSSLSLPSAQSGQNYLLLVLEFSICCRAFLLVCYVTCLLTDAWLAWSRAVVVVTLLALSHVVKRCSDAADRRCSRSTRKLLCPAVPA